jgi:hypothetical protein
MQFAAHFCPAGLHKREVWNEHKTANNLHDLRENYASRLQFKNKTVMYKFYLQIVILSWQFVKFLDLKYIMYIIYYADEMHLSYAERLKLWPHRRVFHFAFHFCGDLPLKLNVVIINY